VQAVALIVATVTAMVKKIAFLVLKTVVVVVVTTFVIMEVERMPLLVRRIVWRIVLDFALKTAFWIRILGLRTVILTFVIATVVCLDVAAMIVTIHLIPVAMKSVVPVKIVTPVRPTADIASTAPIIIAIMERIAKIVREIVEFVLSVEMTSANTAKLSIIVLKIVTANLQLNVNGCVRKTVPLIQNGIQPTQTITPV
jgi:hypothetical protein